MAVAKYFICAIILPSSSSFNEPLGRESVHVRTWKFLRPPSHACLNYAFTAIWQKHIFCPHLFQTLPPVVPLGQASISKHEPFSHAARIDSCPFFRYGKDCSTDLDKNGSVAEWTNAPHLFPICPREFERLQIAIPLAAEGCQSGL